MSLDYIAVQLPELYPYVMLAAGGISFQCLLVGFGAGGKRKTIFGTEAMKEKFNEEHQKHFKADVPKDGYPDHGEGMYGDMLSYEDWYKFSTDQSGHKRFLEDVTVIVFNLLVIGLAFPIVSISLACLNFVLRWFLVCCNKGGPVHYKFRMYSSGFKHLVDIAMLIMTIWSASVFISDIPKVE